MIEWHEAHQALECSLQLAERGRQCSWQQQQHAQHGAGQARQHSWQQQAQHDTTWCGWQQKAEPWGAWSCTRSSPPLLLPCPLPGLPLPSTSWSQARKKVLIRMPVTSWISSLTTLTCTAAFKPSRVKHGHTVH